MDLHLCRKIFEEFRKRAIQAEQVWIGAPIFLLPYLDIHVVEYADITDCSSHIGEVAGDLILFIVSTRRGFQCSVIYCVGVDPQVKAAFTMLAVADWGRRNIP